MIRRAAFATSKARLPGWGLVFLESEDPAVDDEAVRSAMGNECDREILALAQRGPVTAQAILDETSIPKSTLYRRIDRLEEQGLLRVVATTIERGHRIDRYRCPLAELSVRVADGRVEVDWTPAELDEAPQVDM